MFRVTASPVTLARLYRVFDERYVVYWNVGNRESGIGNRESE